MLLKTNPDDRYLLLTTGGTADADWTQTQRHWDEELKAHVTQVFFDGQPSRAAAYFKARLGSAVVHNAICQVDSKDFTDAHLNEVLKRLETAWRMDFKRAFIVGGTDAKTRIAAAIESRLSEDYDLDTALIGSMVEGSCDDALPLELKAAQGQSKLWTGIDNAITRDMSGKGLYIAVDEYFGPANKTRKDFRKGVFVEVKGRRGQKPEAPRATP